MSSVTACAVFGLNDEHASFCLVHEQCQVALALREQLLHIFTVCFSVIGDL
jgi:hypothetical protein